MTLDRSALSVAGVPRSRYATDAVNVVVALPGGGALAVTTNVAVADVPGLTFFSDTEAGVAVHPVGSFSVTEGCCASK